jgi:hypothetical protein
MPLKLILLLGMQHTHSINGNGRLMYIASIGPQLTPLHDQQTFMTILVLKYHERVVTWCL